MPAFATPPGVPPEVARVHGASGASGEAAERRTAQGGQGSWTGFLIIAFAAVGLIGAFGTYAAELPFERAMARSATLDALLAATRSANPVSAEEDLRARLGDSVALLDPPGPTAARIEAERRRVFADLLLEARIYGFRFRCYIALFTAMAAIFGVVVMRLGRRTGESLAAHANVDGRPPTGA